MTSDGRDGTRCKWCDGARAHRTWCKADVIDELQRQVAAARTENERLREALMQVADLVGEDERYAAMIIVGKIATAALAPQTGEVGA